MSEPRDHFVYRTFGSEGELLYVGCTKRLDHRWREHKMERRRMVDLTVSCRLQGPFTREVARRLEREAIRSEEPLFGWTPIKGLERRRRNIWLRDRVSELITSGLEAVAAVQRAVAECDDQFPDPNAHERAAS